jgi:hypothetical protein
MRTNYSDRAEWGCGSRKTQAPVIHLRKVCKVCQPENIAKNVVNREIVALSV